MTIFGRPGSRSFQFPSHTPTQVYRTASRLPPLRIHAFPHGQQVSPHCPARRISTHPRGRSRLEERHPLHRQQGQSLRQLQHARVLGSRDAQIAIDAHGVGSPVTATSSASEPLIAAKPALGPTPLLAPEWKTALQRWRLEQRYPTIVSGIREGFDVGLPKIDKTFIPPNHKSATKDPATVEAKISKELAAGRYCGPFSQTECEQYLGGSFQSSSISLAPKPPDGWRFIQDASFPRDDPRHTSINSQINSNDWPCTWSGIQTVIWQILQLPPSAQAGARDVRPAYRAINLHPSQWAAAVVQWQGRYYVDKALAFGMSSSAGAWGVVGDALADVLRAHGIGPVLKWVDDYLFFRVPPAELPRLNTERLLLHARVQPMHRGGCRFWLDGERELSEDFARPLRDVGEGSNWTYSFKHVDDVCLALGVPWSDEKEQSFRSVVTYYGVEFDLPHRSISLPERKRKSLLDTIAAWRGQPKHTRDDTESLLGQLQFATHVVPNGRQYLTGLATFFNLRHARSIRSAATSTSRSSAVCLCPSPPGATPTQFGLVGRGARESSAPSSPAPLPTISTSTTPAYSPTLAALVLVWCLMVEWRRMPYGFDPSWRNGGRDIMWAEAIGAELGLRHLVAQGTPAGPVRLYIDNTAVEAGIRNGRVRNEAANECLERTFHSASVHDLIIVPALR